MTNYTIDPIGELGYEGLSARRVAAKGATR
jgi:hypothetical protein